MASDAPNPPASLIGRTISGRYHVLERIGEGGMGAVYLAEHVHMRKRVALKVLHDEMLERPEVVARFEREAVAAAHIDHPNVVAATDFGRTEDGSFFLVLEYIEGTSLREALDAGPLAPTRALAIARQIADALSRAHPMGIVHRDLKPENVMLVARGEQGELVKVLDFGIAKVNVDAVSQSSGGVKQVLTRAGTIFGTPEYMAPEQALGEIVDARADLYTLGVMLYEMVTGVRPFEDGEATTVLVQQITTPAPPMSERAPGVAVWPEIEAIAMRLLAKQASERYDDAVKVIAAIDAIAPRDGAAAIPSAPGSYASPASRTHGAEAFAKTSLSLPQTYPSAPRVFGPTALDALRARIPPALRALPPAVLVGVPVLVLLVFAGVIALAAHAIGSSGGTADGGDAGDSVESPAATTAARKLAPDLAAAVAGGPPRLVELARSYPDDPRIARELVNAYTRAGNGNDAMRALVAAIAADPSVATDAQMDQAVLAAAVAPDSVDAAITALEGPLGERGVDLLIDLVTRPSPNPFKERFQTALNRADVRAHASKAASVWLDLKAARSCDAKREMLPRARESGDARTIVLLKPLQRTRGCGFLGRRDCWGCLRKDDALAGAIAAIESRGP